MWQLEQPLLPPQKPYQARKRVTKPPHSRSYRKKRANNIRVENKKVKRNDDDTFGARRQAALRKALLLPVTRWPGIQRARKLWRGPNTIKHVPFKGKTHRISPTKINLSSLKI